MKRISFGDVSGNISKDDYFNKKLVFYLIKLVLRNYFILIFDLN